MLKPLVVTLSLLSSVTASEYLPTEFWEKDKLQHLSASAVMAGGVAYYYLSKGYSKQNAWFTGFSVSLLVGLAKELYDTSSSNHRASVDDIYADAVGSAIGSSLVITFTYRF